MSFGEPGSDPPHRGARRRLLTAGAAAAVVAGIALVAWPEATPELSPAVGSGECRPDPSAPARSGPLPWLDFDVPGDAPLSGDDRPGESLQDAPHWQQTFRCGMSVRRIQVVSVPDRRHWAVPWADATEVGRDGRRLHVFPRRGPHQQVVWRPSEAGLVVVNGIDVTEGELLRFAAGLVPRGDRPGQEAGFVPQGMVLSSDGPVRQVLGVDRRTTSYHDDDRSAELRLTRAGGVWVDDLVVDRAQSATAVTAVVVDGHPAVRLADPHGVSYLWLVRDDVAAELVVRGYAEAEADAIAASVRARQA